jgi:hypothetical protein
MQDGQTVRYPTQCSIYFTFEAGGTVAACCIPFAARTRRPSDHQGWWHTSHGRQGQPRATGGRLPASSERPMVPPGQIRLLDKAFWLRLAEDWLKVAQKADEQNAGGT